MKILECRNLTKHFGALCALSGVDFSLDAGEILGIIGPNGAGKSTLFNCLTGITQASSGKVFLAGEDITHLAGHKIVRRGLAKTSQITQPFHGMTVFENILVAAMYGAGMTKSEAEPYARRMAAFTGLESLSAQSAGALSVPERRRLELGRALACKPKVLLLDENMAGLNPGEVDAAVKLLLEVRDSGVTLVVVEHVMRAVIGLSDRILVLNQGAKIAEGVPAEVMASKSVINVYFGTGGPCGEAHAQLKDTRDAS